MSQNGERANPLVTLRRTDFVLDALEVIALA